MLKVVLATTVLIWAAAANAALSSSYRQSINERVNVWAKTCLAAIPDFSGLESRAKRLGFKPQGRKMLIYKEADMVLSLENNGGKCSCYLTFEAEEPKLAAKLMLKKLLSLGDKFRPTSSPRTVGEIMDKDGPMTVVLLGAKLYGKDWIAARIFGSKPCP
jgi:hypothetical protein